jgi:hypothetical protein
MIETRSLAIDTQPDECGLHLEQLSYVGEKRAEQHVNIAARGQGMQSGVKMLEVPESHQILPP